MYTNISKSIFITVLYIIVTKWELVVTSNQ